MKKPTKQREQQNAPAEKKTPSNSDLRQLIERRAYELWEQSGCQHGKDVEHWLEAEKQFANGQPE